MKAHVVVLALLLGFWPACRKDDPDDSSGGGARPVPTERFTLLQYVDKARYWGTWCLRGTISGVINRTVHDVVQRAVVIEDVTDICGFAQKAPPSRLGILGNEDVKNVDTGEVNDYPYCTGAPECEPGAGVFLAFMAAPSEPVPGPPGEPYYWDSHPDLPLYSPLNAWLLTPEREGRVALRATYGRGLVEDALVRPETLDAVITSHITGTALRAASECPAAGCGDGTECLWDVACGKRTGEPTACMDCGDRPDAAYYARPVDGGGDAP